MGLVMSKGKANIRALTADDTLHYQGETHFSAHEVYQLHKAYRIRCNSDGSVEKEDFVDLFSIYNKSAKALLFLDHIFRTWDFETKGKLSTSDLCFLMCSIAFITPLPHNPKQLHPKQDPKPKSDQNRPPQANVVMKITTPSNVLQKNRSSSKIWPKPQAKTIQLLRP